MTVRLSLFALVLTLSASASASPTQDGGSSLDRLSSTDGILSDARPDASAPSGGTAERDCGGGVTTPGNTPCPPPDAPPVPIDGGLTLLALAGAGYAAKRLRARRA